MSRIGKQPVEIPEGVSVKIGTADIMLSGSKGELKVVTYPEFSIEVVNNQIIIKMKNTNEKDKALYGLLRALIANAVEGVSKGYEKRLELVGTGYRAKKEGANLILNLGFSHPVIIEPVAGIELEIEGEKDIIVKGIDKQLVGQIAAKIRDYRKPEPYKGKGIRYKDEIVRRKPGKAAKLGTTGGT